MAHTGRLIPYQQAQLFTGGLPEHIRIDVKLHNPQDLQHAMAMACAYERHNTAPLLALPAPSAWPSRRPQARPVRLHRPQRYRGHNNRHLRHPHHALSNASR